MADWTPMPATDDELPWPIKAGRSMLWLIDFGDDFPDSRLVVAGKYHLDHGLIRQPCDGGGFYRHTVRGYQEQPSPKLPHEGEV